MNNLSDYIEIQTLNHFLRGRAHVKPESYWYALFAANPGDKGDVAFELTGGGYARVEAANNKVNFPQCAATGIPTKRNGESILFPTATANQGTASHWGIFDAPAGVTFSGTTSSGSITIAVAATSALRVGMSLTGTGVPAGSVVASIITNTSITISNSDPALADTCTASGVVTITVVPRFIVYSALTKKILIKTGKTPKIPSEALAITLPQGPLGGFTRYSMVKALDHLFGHLVFPSPVTVYSGFGTNWSSGGGATEDSFTEWGDSGYDRQITAFLAPVSGTGLCTTSGSLNYTGGNGVADGAATLNSIGVWDDSNAGQLLFAGSARKAFAVANTDLVRVLAGNLSISLQ